MSGSLYRSAGAEISLGRKVGTGGEGAVFEIVGSPNIVCKIYHRKPDGELQAKLTALVSVRNERISSFAAWPIDTVRSSGSNSPVGFLMPRVTGYEPIHKLYSPRDRKATFPQADWAFLVVSARNIAAAIDEVHSNKHVVGDINENSVLVNKGALAKFIDCDSFQIQLQQRVFRCRVGVPLYTPPELQGLSFDSVVRTPNHDNFSLAVLIFHLLMLGRHPFAGRFSGREDMPIEKAIKTGRYAYGSSGGSKGMEPPPATAPISALSPDVGKLFEGAFADSTSIRPTASAWANGLDSLFRSLAKCQQNKLHSFYSKLSACPWCELENTSGTIFFLPVGEDLLSRLAVDAQTFEGLLRRFHAFPKLTLPQFADPNSLGATGQSLPPIGGALESAMSMVFRLGGFIFLFVLFMNNPKYWFIWAVGAWILFAMTKTDDKLAPLRAEISRRQSALRTAEEHWKKLLQQAVAHCGIEEAITLQKEIEKLERTYRDLPAWKVREIESLRAKARERQLNLFLEQFSIRSASIPNIGDSRKAMLASFGIESAADISTGAIVGLRGFGPGLASDLNAWKNHCAASFRFDASKATTTQDLLQIDQHYQHRLQELTRELLAAIRKLAQVIQVGQGKRAEVKSALDKTAMAVAQAREDVRVAEMEISKHR